MQLARFRWIDEVWEIEIVSQKYNTSIPDVCGETKSDNS